MDERPHRQDDPAESNEEMVECPWCKRRVPLAQTRNISGRTLCFGCLDSWYEEGDD